MIQGCKILVTGGAGFIGSNLCERLLSLNNHVVCFDNFSTGKRANITPFLSNDRFRLIEGDIRDLNNCKQAVSGADYVLHQAALGSVPRSIASPITTNDVNISGFLNMLVATRDEGIKRFVYAASSSTYGDSEALPKVESVIGQPLSPYAITKYVNELYADVFNKVYGLDTIGLRYFNVFGPRQSPDGAYAAVIPKFIATIKDNKAPTINGDGSHSRDFTYIENVIQMNLLALTTTNKKALNQVYNTAFGERTTLNQLFNYILMYMAENYPEVAELKPIYGPNRMGDIPHSLASIEKAKGLLNYKPQYSIQMGLKETVEWFVKKQPKFL